MKVERDFELNYLLDWEFEVSMDVLEKDIKALKELGATSVSIESFQYYDSTSVQIKAICRRMETDEEYAERIRVISARDEQRRQRDLEQLEELKKKYGNE